MKNGITRLKCFMHMSSVTMDSFPPENATMTSSVIFAIVLIGSYRLLSMLVPLFIKGCPARAPPYRAGVSVPFLHSGPQPRFDCGGCVLHTGFYRQYAVAHIVQTYGWLLDQGFVLQQNPVQLLLRKMYDRNVFGWMCSLHFAPQKSVVYVYVLASFSPPFPRI